MANAASTDPLVTEEEVFELYARVVDFMEALQFCIPTKGQGQRALIGGFGEL